MKTQPHRVLRLLVVFAIFLIAGCASVERATPSSGPDSSHWHGRLALKVYSTPVQAFSANFDLRGSAESGSLTLSTSLGNTLARMQWSPTTATLETSNGTRASTTLSALVQEVTGTDLPVADLFAWLQGRNSASPPWEADLSEIDHGRLTARRTTEPNAAELKVLLDR
ncbi:MAG: outer membrane lipoprotein LolB [Burkholderiales bacterium]|nr:outer membrane lipoprotein LolB [Burkholderiales bacterium]